MATADTGSRTAAVLAVCLLAVVPLAGCLSGGVGAGVPEEDPTSPSTETRTNRSDPHLRVSVEATNATSIVLELRARPPNATVQVSSRPKAPPDPQRVRSVSADRSRVALDDLAPNRSYRVRARLVGTGGETIEEAAVEARTDPVPWAGSDEAVVRPGIGLVDPACTLGFVLTSRTNASVYAVVAGHCWGLQDDAEQGDPVTTYHPDPYRARLIGHVAIYEHRGGTGGSWDEGHAPEYDWGLVRIRPALRWRTSPSILNVTGPTGVADAAEMERGDRVCWQGNTGWFQTVATYQYSQRCGAFASYARGNATQPTCHPTSREDACVDTGHGDGLNWFSWYGVIGAGDSGSPVVDAATGEALGIITNLYKHPSAHPLYDGVAEGPTLASILDRAAERGWHLRLAQAEYREPAG